MDNATPVAIEDEEATTPAPRQTMAELVWGDEAPTPVPCEGCDEYGLVLVEGLCKSCDARAEESLWNEGPRSLAEDR
jgi:hypothetical protein